MVFVCQAKMFSIFKTVLLFSIVLVAFILHEINADKNRQNTCDGSHGKCGLFKTVETDYGAIRGRVEKSLIHQKKYYSFKGIPYAKEPTGELRFKVCSVCTVHWSLYIMIIKNVYLPNCKFTKNHNII